MSIPPGSTALALLVPSLVHQRVFEGNIGLDFPLCTSDDVDPAASPRASEQQSTETAFPSNAHRSACDKSPLLGSEGIPEAGRVTLWLFAARLDQT